MENTTNGILAGLGTMLVAVVVVAALVWLAYRLADRS
jgi:type IV secretory pathway TrbF-like protein